MACYGFRIDKICFLNLAGHTTVHGPSPAFDTSVTGDLSGTTLCPSRQAAPTGRSMFEQIYGYYERPEAWNVTPGAVDDLRRLRAAGVQCMPMA